MRKMTIVTAVCGLFALVLNVSALQVQQPEPKPLGEIMKEISKTQASLNRNLRGQNAMEIANDAGKIQELYKSTDATWKKHGFDDAAKTSKDVQMAAEGIVKAARAYDFSTANEQFQVVARSCKSCHDVHRERLPDGTYRIKQ